MAGHKDRNKAENKGEDYFKMLKNPYGHISISMYVNIHTLEAQYTTFVH